jgi:hypothetical protein
MGSGEAEADPDIEANFSRTSRRSSAKERKKERKKVRKMRESGRHHGCMHVGDLSPINGAGEDDIVRLVPRTNDTMFCPGSLHARCIARAIPRRIDAAGYCARRSKLDQQTWGDEKSGFVLYEIRRQEKPPDILTP